MSDISILGSDGSGHPSEPAEPGAGPPGRGPKRRRPGYIAPVVSLVVVALVGLRAFAGARSIFHRFNSTPDYSGSGTGTAYLQVELGYTTDDIGNAMVNAGVLKSIKAFRSAAADDPRSLSIQPGRYQLRKHMSADSALTLLLDPASHVGRITIPEGLTNKQLFARVAKATRLSVADFTAAAARPITLGLPAYADGQVEGYLFPTTYDLPAKSSARDILRTMIGEQRTQIDSDTVRQGAGRLGITPAQVIVVASLLEEEGITGDFPKIARVIYNRLAIRRPLQLDSTVNYALGRNNVQVSQAQTQTPSPYNTYLHRGLPPGAICNPGANAVDAALHPAAGNWLYFVKKNKAGESFFTADPNAFAAQKRKSQAQGVY